MNEKATAWTRSLKVNWLDVELQFSQNSKKIRKIRTNFCCSLSSRSDGNIATTRPSTLILIKQQNRSIQTIFSRGWCADLWCVYVSGVFWSGWSRTLFKDRAHFPKVKSIDWTLAPEQPMKYLRLFTGSITARECPGSLLSRTRTYRPHLPGVGPTSSQPFKAPRNECFRIHDDWY